MENKLFVYGTLLRGIQSKIARYFHDNSDFLGEAFVPGRLYDLGYYPGLDYQPDSSRRVFGHVLALKEPEEVLEVLDQYEGLGEEEPGGREYRRSLVEANMNGEKISCWAYVLTEVPVKAREIPSGDYIKYLDDNEDHQHFIRST